MALQWMGENRSLGRHPHNMVAVFIAGLIFVMGVHSSFNLGPALKPQRLERLQSPETARKSISVSGEQECRNRDKAGNNCVLDDEHPLFVIALSQITRVSPQSTANDAEVWSTPIVATGRYVIAPAPRGPPDLAS